MTQPVLDIAAVTSAAVAQQSQNTAINRSPWPSMQPDLAAVDSFNEIFASTMAGSLELQKKLKPLQQQSLNPDAILQLQKLMANLSVNTEFTAKVLGSLSTALKTLVSMQ